MNIKQKLTSAVVLGSMVAAIVAPASFAATTVTISNNGALSTNKVKVKNWSSKSVSQSNTTYVGTSISAKAKTGNNTSSFNTGGTNGIVTGDASNTVGVSVTGGTNTNTGNECGCASPTTNVTIADNGAMSTNTVHVKNSSSNSVTQGNITVVQTEVWTSANTGGNSSSFNTGGGNTITSGGATNEVGVEVGGSTNTN